MQIVLQLKSFSPSISELFLHRTPYASFSLPVARTCEAVFTNMPFIFWCLRLVHRHKSWRTSQFQSCRECSVKIIHTIFYSHFACTRYDFEHEWQCLRTRMQFHLGILTSATASDESQIIEFGHLIFHDGRTIPQLAAIVFIVSGFHGDHRSIADVA